MRYSVGAWHSTVTRSRASDLEPLRRVEAAVVKQAGGAPAPRARRTSCAPTSTSRWRRCTRRGRPAARAEPVLGLHGLAPQVALGVDGAARLARRAGGEDQQRRVVRRAWRGEAGELSADSRSSSTLRWRGAVGRPCRARCSSSCRSRSANSTSRGRVPLDPQGDVLGAQLLGAGKRRRRQGATRRAARTPTPGRAPDQRHHHVPRADAELVQLRRPCAPPRAATSRKV